MASRAFTGWTIHGDPLPRNPFGPVLPSEHFDFSA